MKLAVVFSAMAAMVAMTLDAVGDVSTTGLVVVVAIVGFTTSWVHTGRVTRTVASRRVHRISVMPLHQPIA